MEYWKDGNRTIGRFNPVLCKNVALAILSAQASSSSAEVFFRDLGRIESIQLQSLFSRYLEMLELIKEFLKT